MSSAIQWHICMNVEPTLVTLLLYDQSEISDHHLNSNTLNLIVEPGFITLAFLNLNMCPALNND